MKNLFEYIKPSFLADSHIHLFDHARPIEHFRKPMDIPTVGFMDIVFDKLEEYKNSIPYYRNYIERHLKDNVYLLATGTSSKNIIDIYKEFPDKIKGFGELKCYDHYVNGELPFGDPFYFKELYDFDNDLQLPIYIHYNLFDEKRIKRFEELLTAYPKIPFVLCHCGMDKEHDCEFAYRAIRRLLSRFGNLYVDVSYTAAKWFLKHQEMLVEVPKDRLLLGSDMSPLMFYGKSGATYSYNELKILNEISSSRIAFDKLFKTELPKPCSK